MTEPKRRQRPKGVELRASLKPKKAAIDPYLSRNEFKEGFYDQPTKPPITPATMYGTASGKTMFEPNIVDPDTKMIQDTLGMSEGGFLGQYPVQVKKVPFKGTF
jgi:hypothetical protein